MRIRALVINDPHAAASPPMGARDLYVEDVLNMLREARDYARSEKCQYTIFTGDLFHAKRNVPHWLVRSLIELFADWPGRKLAIVGNHDLNYHGLSSVPQQPIGVLFEAGVLEWLREDIVTCDRIATPKGPTMSDDLFIQWSPANYFDQLDHNPQNFGLERAKSQPGSVRDVHWAVKVAHGTIVPPGKPFPYHTVPMNTIPTEGMDLVLYGHPHYDASVQEVNGCTFACLGSIGRTQRTEENLTRAMRLLMVEFTLKTMSFVELPLTSAAAPSDLFFEKEVESNIGLDSALKRFVSDLESAISLEDGDSLDEVVAKLSEGVDDRAKVRLIDYLDKAGLNG